MSDIPTKPLVLHLNRSNYSEIVLNTPENLNSFCYRHVTTLDAYFKACSDNKDVEFIIFRGAGRAFCAGGHLKYILGTLMSKAPDFHLNSFVFHSLLYTMVANKKPVICYMDGLTAGGGLGLALHSTFKIATENTVISLPEGRIGHFCDATNSFYLSRLDGYLGVYLALTGHKLKAEDVVFAGLATHFVPSSELEALGERLSQLPNITLDAIDCAIQEVAVKASHKPSQCTLFGHKLELIERCFKYNKVEEIVEALQKENSKFAESCLKSMSEFCPSSLKINLHVITEGTNMTMFQSIDQDRRGWSVIPHSYNYVEGVKSLFEKRRPMWHPATIEDVQDDIETTYFPIDNTVYSYNPATDFMTSPYQRFLPPTSSEVQFIQLTKDLNSHRTIINWFLKNRNFKFGTREIVENILKKQSKKNVLSLAVSTNEEFACKL